MDLKGKVALVTGSSRGIGKETAALLASYVSSIAICALDQAECEEAADFIRANFSVPAIAVSCDVTKQEEVKSAVSQINLQLGPIDILVNNAGAMLLKPFTETSTEEWIHMFDVNGTYKIETKSNIWSSVKI